MWEALSPVKEDCPLGKAIGNVIKCTGPIEGASSVQPEQDKLNVTAQA